MMKASSLVRTLIFFSPFGRIIRRGLWQQYDSNDIPMRNDTSDPLSDVFAHHAMSSNTAEI